jgi:glycine oxidase
MKCDYIIVGQGLAGSSLAIQLIRANKKVIVFDDAAANNSSRIAAGLFNPITGQNLVKTWLADTIFPYLHTFYRSIEAETGLKFLHTLPLYRPFSTIEEQNEWMGRSADPAYDDYLQKIHTQSLFAEVNDSTGGLVLRNCGFVDTTKFIQATRIQIEQHGTLINEVLNPDEVKVFSDKIVYREIEASRIIFCSGTHKNKWFDWLPVRGLKGETLTIRNNFNHKIVLNRGVYMIPGDQPFVWRVGATYNFHDRADGPTEKGKLQLVQKLRELITIPFEIISYEWGFRPTTIDRRPILGSHPQTDRVVIFNGLGTKGISLAPYFSEVLFHWLENKGSIHKEVDIERFKSVYSSSPK